MCRCLEYSSNLLHLFGEQHSPVTKAFIMDLITFEDLWKPMLSYKIDLDMRMPKDCGMNKFCLLMVFILKLGSLSCMKNNGQKGSSHLNISAQA